jgi:glutaminase
VLTGSPARQRRVDYQAILEEISTQVRQHLGKGKVADYIPALARVPADKFGMVVRTVDGDEYRVGNAEEPFSIQSISKLFVLMLAVSRLGDLVWTRVGKEPSGDPFNSLVLLEHEHGVPRNPFINAGALVVLDLLMHGVRDSRRLIRDYLRVLSQNFALDFDRHIARSERRHAHTNLALANLMKSHGQIAGHVDRLLDVYCHQCSLAASCLDLARACLPLAASGYSPLLGEAVLTARQARRINALMLTCGTYDSVGSFAYRVGLPAKSGVGGGIVALVPRVLSVAVWSPELDRSGNSYVGTAALELFTTITRHSVF